ncbi:MAG: methylmalonyl-CoA mutase [Candidatus Eisenbacteria bacterium]|nr:methylmalonyl-CoA mutase [Candidatus Eisenbacteria bacterium]
MPAGGNPARDKSAGKPRALRHERFETSSGLEVQGTYRAADVAPGLQERLGDPGAFPFTRGVHADMYRARLWTMRQYAGFGDADESNRRYRYLLEQGQTGLSVAFDLPTQMGYDSDSPRAAGEVGKVGVAVATRADMERLMEAIPQETVSVSMTINATASILLAFYLALAEKRGVAFDRLNGTVQNDILKEYAARGTYIFPLAPSMRLTTDLIAFCFEKVPSWNTISISGYHIREAGSTAAQELAFTLGNGLAYVQAAVDAGLDVDAFAPRLSFFFNSHNLFFEEVAKFRAARRMWARFMRERFHAKGPRSWLLRFHTQTAGSTLTAQQPENNVVRVTLQALAAALGGTQSLHTNSMDEALSLPTQIAVRTALRTQQIIGEESGVADTADPLAGSYFVERLTDDLEAAAMKILDEVGKMGGMPRAIEQGWVQREIHRSAYAAQRAIEDGRLTVVGVNKYAVEEPEKMQPFAPDEASAARQLERLREFRAARSEASAAAARRELESGAKGAGNLLPRILDCVKADVTLGEISDSLRSVWGEYSAVKSL